MANVPSIIFTLLVRLLTALGNVFISSLRPANTWVLKLSFFNKSSAILLFISFILVSTFWMVAYLLPKLLISVVRCAASAVSAFARAVDSASIFWVNVSRRPVNPVSRAVVSLFTAASTYCAVAYVFGIAAIVFFT